MSAGQSEKPMNHGEPRRDPDRPVTAMRPLFIRAARAEDQPTIRAMVRAAHLHPLALDWPRFIVAEEHGQIVAIGQIKLLGDGTRELASIVTAPTHRGLGIGATIVRTLQAADPAPLFLRCATHNVGFYARLGFVELTPDAMPHDLRRTYLIVSRVARLINAVTGGQETMHIMGCNLPAPSPVAATK